MALTLKQWALVGACAFALPWGWRWAQRWSVPSAPAGAVQGIQFDTGTVRQMASASDVASQAVAPLKAPGGVRKCRTKAGSLVYTDRDCPPGSKEADLGQGTVNIIAATPVPKPAAPPAAEPTLQDRMIQRATGQ